jgi:tetratricopeptide (TPR) repeat protein
MENLEYIDDYFNGDMLPGQTRKFEERIVEDPAFAEEVAFYVSVKEVARERAIEGKKRRFNELYRKSDTVPFEAPGKKYWPYLAAAAIITGIIIWFYMFDQNPSPQKIADRYIEDNFQTLGISMAGTQDSLQLGLRSYNEGRHLEALQKFEAINRSDSTDFTSKKYAGIVSLELGDYEKAIFYFKKLEQQPGLFANPGKFYHALTLMKRGKPGDVETARRLLKEVIELNLEGKDNAQQWLRQLQ